MKKAKIILVGGARPNFVKVAALIRAINSCSKFSCILVHTGQHYDYAMSESFFDDLDIIKPNYFLGVGSGTHSQQTAKAMVEFEKVCLKEKPNLVIVVGDVNSTLACCITAKKLNIGVAHIEAGLRSFDMTMPEEINRIVIDSIADYLFVTEESGIHNLEKEGKIKNNVFFVGNTMIDTLIFGLEKLKKINFYNSMIYKIKQRLSSYGVVTLHRPSNVDFKEKLFKLTNTLNTISHILPLIFPLHPRTKRNLKRFNLSFSKNIIILPSLRYLEFLFLYKDAKFVLTDSGGLQEETTFLNIPCFTLRQTTERPVTITKGTNIIIGNRIESLPRLINFFLAKKIKRNTHPLLWDGRSSLRIIKILKTKL